MTYPHSAITAAAHVIHNNYSDVDMFEATTGELAWAEGTARAVAEKLGESEEHQATKQVLMAFRAHNLALGDALTRVWEAAGRSPVSGFGIDPSEVPQAVIEAIQAARAPREEIEITDTMVNNLALAIYGPSVVYDRTLIRSALANALQTR